MKSLVAAVTLGLLSPAWSPAQTIGDIARQERDRQKTVQSTATLTNTPTISTSDSIIENAGPTKVPASNPVAEEKPNNPVNALEEARTNLKSAEDEVVSLQLSLAQARLELIQKRDDASHARLTKSVDQLSKMLSLAEKRVLAQKEKIKRLEMDSQRLPKAP